MVLNNPPASAGEELAQLVLQLLVQGIVARQTLHDVRLLGDLLRITASSK